MRGHPDTAPTRLGPYELVRRIATGGMAEVYLARREGPRGFQKHVAVKRILPQFSRDAEFVAMFVDEARVCARLAHPHIVQVFDFGEHDDELYMAMEYVQGTTGARLIRTSFARGEDIPLEVSLYVTLSVVRALEYAHNARDDTDRPLDLVHRDVSPGNVLIDRSGTVKLTDFGIARAAEIERRTDVGHLKGKMGYMSPEQVLGRELDARSDLFSAGIVLAEMVLRRPLFAGGRELDVLMRIRDVDLSAIDRAPNRVPDDVRAILFRALTRDPAVRFPNASLFAEAIENIVRRRRLQIGPSRLAQLIDRWGLVDGSLSDVGPPSSSDLDDEDATTRKSVGQSPVPSPDSSKHAYKLLTDAGTEFGPLSYPNLIELFATGRATMKALVSRDEGRFRPATEFQELSRFATSPALRWGEPFPRDGEERGRLDRAKFVSLMFRLFVRRETGALMMRDGSRQKKVYLVDGCPEFVASTEKRELLGEYLVSRGQVLRMEVDMALAMLPRFGGRLGDALVGLGILRPVELFRAIFDQTTVRIEDLFTWKEGELTFIRSARSQEETFPLGIDPYELIARGVRKGYSPDELESILKPFEEEVIEPVFLPPMRLEAFRLPESEQTVIDLVAEKTTLGRLMARASVDRIADPEEVLRAVFLALSCELVKSPKWVIPPSLTPRRAPSSRPRGGTT